MEDHRLDEFEYLGAMEKRDEVEKHLHKDGHKQAMTVVDEIDGRFRAITQEDARFAAKFAEQASPGWWRRRTPADRKARSYLLGWEYRIRAVPVRLGPRFGWV